MPHLDEIGRNVVRLRKAQGLTQEQVAFHSNISISRLRDIEYGCKNTTIDTLIRLARALQVDSRIMGVFSMTDRDILSKIQGSFRLKHCINGPLQICENIVQLRKTEKLTQKELAQRSNVSIARLRDIEHRCANVTTDKLFNIADAFGMSLVELSAMSMSEAEIFHLIHRSQNHSGDGGSYRCKTNFLRYTIFCTAWAWLQIILASFIWPVQ